MGGVELRLAKQCTRVTLWSAINMYAFAYKKTDVALMNKARYLINQLLSL